MVEAAVRKSAKPAGTSRPQATALRECLPALPPARAEALRGFFGREQRWYLPDGGVLRFLPSAGCGDGEAFELEAEGARLALCLHGGGRVVDGPHWSDYRGRSRTLAWGLAHEPQLMRLSEALGASLLPIAALEPGTAAAGDDTLWLDFAIEEAQPQSPLATCSGSLRVPLPWLARLSARSGQLYGDDPPPDPGRWLQLPAVVQLRFAGPSLAAGQWRQLQPGDVIVTGSPARPPQVHAHAAGRAWPLVPSADGWRIEAPFVTDTPFTESSPQEHAVSDTDATEPTPAAHADGAADGAAANRDLPVRIEFEVARTELSVGELAGLQPGYVFALPAQLEGANVTVRANGRAVGRGELVAVGDTLGVRLLAWS